MFTSTAVTATSPDALAVAIAAVLNGVPGITVFAVTAIETYTPGVYAAIVTYQ